MVRGVSRRFLFLDSPRAAFAPSFSPPYCQIAAKSHSPPSFLPLAQTPIPPHRPKSKTKITQDANLKGSKSIKSQTLKTKNKAERKREKLAD